MFTVRFKTSNDLEVKLKSWRNLFCCFRSFSSWEKKKSCDWALLDFKVLEKPKCKGTHRKTSWEKQRIPLIRKGKVNLSKIQWIRMWRYKRLFGLWKLSTKLANCLCNCLECQVLQDWNLKHQFGRKTFPENLKYLRINCKISDGSLPPALLGVLNIGQ